jgi:hypothetical protein
MTGLSYRTTTLHRSNPMRPSYSLLSAVSVAALCALDSAASGAPVRVLLPGAGTPVARTLALEIGPLLTQNGAAFEKTEGFPSEAQLKNADVVILAGQDFKTFGGEAKTALEAFAKRGGGVVAIGSALQAGDWMQGVVGGASTPQSRKFSNKLMFMPVTDAHPLTRNATAFDIEDETWYDLATAPSIQVLASAFTPKVTSKKVDPRAPEKLDRANVYDLQPQLWAYEAPDSHRAVVLMQEKENALHHASIRSFLLRGIAWAARQENTDAFCSKTDLASLRYPKDGARTAADTVKSLELQPGFKASVIASEPLINKPIAMQWDGQGRLWVAETPEYPNGRRPLNAETWKETGVLKPGDYERPATDRISILSEPDANGAFTKKTVFHEGLELVTGFCLYGDGVIAVGQPDIVFIHGQGEKQRVERLYTGFKPGDTHFVANHFIVAPDGWIYANTGSGPAVESVNTPGVKAQLSSGMFRFKPDGSAIQQVSSKGGNGFGADVTSDGELFFNQATSGNPVQHVGLPEWILAKGASSDLKSGAQSVIEQRKVVRPDMPDRGPFMQIDVVGGYSSSCASAVNEGGAWPAEWAQGVFCTEPILDIVHHEKLIPQGATFTGDMVNPNSEFIRAKDFWFFPIDLQFGPDGAMYLLDFYNPIVAHSDTRGPQHSRAGASIRPDREHYFGRIYRIQHDAAKTLTRPNLEQADAAALVTQFTHPNRWTRFTAHRLLMDRADAAKVAPALTKMAEGEAFAPARILALWALARLDQLSPQTLQLALKSEDAGVRKSALLVVESLGPKNSVHIAGLLDDSDARVRLTTLRAMASSPLNTAGAQALLAALPKLSDPWSRSAAIAAAASNPRPILEAALASSEIPSNALLDLAHSLARSVAEKNHTEALVSVVQAASKAAPSSEALVRTVLEAFASVPTTAPAPLAPVREPLKSLLSAQSSAVAAAVMPIAAAWAKDELGSEISASIENSLKLAEDSKAAAPLRASAIRGLLGVRHMDGRILDRMLALLGAKTDDGLAVEMVKALSSSEDAALGKRLIPLLPTLSPIAQSALFDALTGRPAWANALLDALEAKTLKVSLLGPSRMSKLRLHPDAATAKRATQVIQLLGSGTNPAKDEIIAKLEPEISAKAGDIQKGKELFAAACATCHKFNNAGMEVGPVLDGIGVHGIHELLIHVIDPSRVVDNEHRTWNIALKNGNFATGIIARENDRSLLLKMAGGATQDIVLADIKLRQEVPQSLMPEGFEALGAEGLRDIFAYLGGGNSKYRALNLGTAFTTDTESGGLYQSRAAKEDSVRPLKFGVVTAENIPFSLPDPSTTPTGGNVIVLKNNDGPSYASTLPQRVEIPVGFTAGNLHFLSGIVGWGGTPEMHKPAMKVTIEHTEGPSQVEELYSGDVFIDYNSGLEVPGSKRVAGLLKKHHVRYFWLPVSNRAPISKVVLESYKNGMSPTTLAITADNDAPKPREKTVFKPATPAAPPADLPKSGETLPLKQEAGVLRTLLIGGGSSHDFERFFRKADGEILREGGKIVTAYTSNAEEAVALMPNADVIVISANHKSFGTPEFQQPLNRFADAGHGIVVVHAGSWYNWAPVSGYNRRFVGGGARGHGKGEFTVFNKQPSHPVMAGIPADFKIVDEHYRVILEPDAPVEVLAETDKETQTQLPYPSVWLVKDPKARIVGIGLGHGEEAHTNPAYRKLLQNAVLWVAGK